MTFYVRETRYRSPCFLPKFLYRILLLSEALNATKPGISSSLETFKLTKNQIFNRLKLSELSSDFPFQKNCLDPKKFGSLFVPPSSLLTLVSRSVVKMLLSISLFSSYSSCVWGVILAVLFYLNYKKKTKDQEKRNGN